MASSLSAWLCALFALLCTAPAATAAPPEIPRTAVAYRNALIRETRFFHGLAAPNALFFAQVHQESRWRADAVSHAGAQGLTQFIPSTAAWIQRAYPHDFRELCNVSRGCPFDPRWALRAMLLYDRALYTESRFLPARDRWAGVLVAYNGGSGHLTRETARCAQQPTCEPQHWFGHVERFCIRAAWACAESRAYPRAVIDRWMPLYTAWLGPVAGVAL